MAARSEAEKAQDEVLAVRRFIERSGLPLDASSIHKRIPPEPDLLCQGAEGLVAFDIANLCDGEVAKVLAAGARARTDAFSTTDPSAAIVRDKLSRSYKTDHPIELFLYTEGRIMAPDDVIIPTVTSILESLDGPYRKAWFMGEKTTCLLWQAS
jgi:hypothetical protein